MAAKLKINQDKLLNSVGVPVLIMTNDGVVMAMNIQAQKMLGVKKLAKATNLRDVLDIENEKGKQLELKNVLFGRTPRPTSSDTQTQKLNCYIKSLQNGNKFFAELTVIPLEIERNCTGVTVVLRDVSQEQKAEQAKDEFMALASHQLRTFPTVINWSIETLLADEFSSLNKRQRELFEEIYRSNHKMLKLVNTLADVSRVEASILSVQPSRTNVISLIKDVLYDDFGVQITNKDLRINEKYENERLVLGLDAKLFRIVLQNLISNAIKYTPKGGHLTVAVKQLPARVSDGDTNTKKRSSWTVVISDSGYGIPKRQQGKIFTRLFRADNAKKEDNTGTGLGLYITKSILDRCGCDIWFESKENHGTKFFVTLPSSAHNSKKENG